MAAFHFKIAEQRHQKADRAQQFAFAHGIYTAHGERYMRERDFWRAAAHAAENGDTAPVTFKAEA